MSRQLQFFICASVMLLLFEFPAIRTFPAYQTNDPPAVICNLPPQRGHCRALLPRWRYDPSTGKCSEFKFGGCDGNGNNFNTEKECMAVCAGI